MCDALPNFPYINSDNVENLKYFGKTLVTLNIYRK